MCALVRVSQRLKKFQEDNPRPHEYQRDELPSDSGEVFNFIMAFLFQECRDALGVKRYIKKAAVTVCCITIGWLCRARSCMSSL